MSGDALLDRCLAAHGGLDRWRQFEAIDVDLTTSGLVFATHGQRSLRTMARVATREPLVVLSPYRRWPRGVFQRDRVFIEDAAGRVMAERKNPRSRMGRGRRLLWWDTLDTLYFVGYALSNYVRAPFMFCQGGFHVASAGVATFGSETWSKLRVTFPPDEPTHSPTQMYYLDAAHLIRRLDYVAEPIGRWARAAHFCEGYREWHGLRVPTDRWVVPRTRNDRACSWPPLVQIRITAVRPITNALVADRSSHTHASEAPRSLQEQDTARYTMMLQNKNALILGAGGAIGSAVARRLTAEGAHVFLAGRTESVLESLAAELDAPWERVDGTDEAAVSAWVDRVAREAGGIDVVFNAIGPRPNDAHYATPSMTIPYERFALPLNLIVGSQFLTARAAARHMVPRGRGAIVFLSASLTGQFIPYMSGITAACGAVEAFSRTLATEFGPAGVRVNCVRAGGMPETRTIAETTANMAATMGVETDEAARSTASNVLRRPLRVEETAATVAWVASDMASGVAGQVVNVCAGAIVSR